MRKIQWCAAALMVLLVAYNLSNLPAYGAATVHVIVLGYLPAEDFGSPCTDATLQDALDYAENLPGNFTPLVHLGAVECLIAATTDLRSSGLVGISTKDTILRWVGPADGTQDMIVRGSGYLGGGAYLTLTDIQFRCGGARHCANFSNLPNVDSLFNVNRDQFIGASSHALLLPRFINGHFEDVRFDGPGDCAMMFVATAGDNLGNLSILFTADHNGQSHSRGSICFDLRADPSNVGVVKISGRVEMNTTVGPDFGVVWIDNAGARNPRSISVELANFTYFDGKTPAGADRNPGDALIHATAGGFVLYTWNGVSVEGLSKTTSGLAFDGPPPTADGKLQITSTRGFSGPLTVPGGTETLAGVRLSVVGRPFISAELRPDGLCLGDGLHACDVRVTRVNGDVRILKPDGTIARLVADLVGRAGPAAAIPAPAIASSYRILDAMTSCSCASTNGGGDGSHLVDCYGIRNSAGTVIWRPVGC